MLATVRSSRGEKSAMKQFIEASAMRIGALVQYACANVDFEVVSLPGGSAIAVLLCLYAVAFQPSATSDHPPFRQGFGF